MAAVSMWLRGVVMRLHPARAVVLAFGTVTVAGATLLALPASSQSGEVTGPVDALFTATSAVCVTGLAVVDTGSYWSGFGQAVILGLIQVGGFGIMTMASLLALLISGRMRMRLELTAQAETKSLGLGEVRAVIVRVAVITLVAEGVTALLLAARFRLGYGEPLGDAVYSGVFHAVSAFNNAGFGLYPDSLVRYAADPWVTLPVAAAVILGGIGFPVIIEVLRYRARHRATGSRNWSLHLKLTVTTTAALLAAGTALTLGLEWANPGTLGPMDVPGKLLNAFFHSAMSRTAGFNALDIAALGHATLFATCVLMFIGGGSAGTAGGIKVTTFAVLGAAILAEVRGEPDSGAFRRRLSPHVLRQALTVALLGVGLVAAAVIALQAMAGAGLEVVLFETVSAFGTVGLSAGLTAELPPAGELILVMLMFVGRLGPITLASALALRERTRRFHYPEERPVIG
ncbi:TrkH family potassium uptake protein [Streptomyces aidingensis]|uniref:Potassium uptake protein, TrkH family n=1 Tax=Streptomyces aidingensis TaxID=910347 RepID=A0A1I1RTI8_9ACTN|nr:potassium transporter TrkG [Streptomyces aidingensis]SFD35548.1 potassium uptake protein, TrkH family [Streptomyces aidingensis]